MQFKKRHLLFLVIILSCIFACDKDEIVKVVSVTLSSTSVTLTEGESEIIAATVSPDNAENKIVIWSSSDSSVATIHNGKVTAVKAGEAIITVITDDGGKTANCTVTVEAKTIDVESIALNKNTLEMTVGDSETLTVNITPENATTKEVTWTSSNTSIATVIDGIITAQKEGTTLITVKTKDEEKTASCTVTVKAKTIDVESVALSKNTLEMTVGDSETLTVTIAPENSTNKKVTWTSNNTSVATVANGTITAHKEGSAVITVKTEDGGKIANCNVTVKPKAIGVESVALNKNSLEMTVGDSETLTATITPGNATNKKVTWISNNTSVATVTNGTITAHKEGSALIAVKTEDGEKIANCAVTVKTKTISVESVALNKNTLELTVGQSETLTATITPENATNKKITWTSSNIAVVTVTNGIVRAIKEGVTTVTVKTEDGGNIATCQVTVKPDPVISNFVITTGTISNLTPISVSISSSFKGFSSIIGKAWKFGISYGKNPNPNVSDNVIYTHENKDGTYELNININPDEIYYYRAVAYYDGNYYYGEVRSFTSPFLPSDFQAVDLGLSVKWSTCNLGANSTNEDGDYYAWGEVETKSIYNRTTYKYYDSKVEAFINLGNDISGTQYDAAHIKLGNGWRMPTYNEVSELYHECTWEATTYKGKQGYLVTGKNGNSIFVVTVSCTDTSSSKMRYSHFWTSTADPSATSIGLVFYLNYSYFTVNNTYMAKTTDRSYGLPIRPVYD